MARERIAIAPNAPEAAARREILDRARQRGFSQFVVREGDPVAPGPGEEFLVRGAQRIVRAGAAEPIPVVRVGTADDLEAAVRNATPGGILAIEWSSDRVIPLENAIAARGRRFELWTYARTAAEVPGALGALEHGADRVIVELASPSDVDALELLVEGSLPTDLAWTTLELTAVAPVGIGDRVLVDTTSLLRPEEGLLIGSAAAFLFHVASEAVGSRFSRPRPFRVNAGSAHSYVLLADGSTRYLSELEPGDPVLAVAPRSTARAVRVGRVKIERRPMVVARADDDGTARTVFLQEAETVRLSTSGGRVASTELKPGLRIDGVRMAVARHLGRAVEETIEER